MKSSKYKRYLLNLCKKYDLMVYDDSWSIEMVFKNIDMASNYVMAYLYDNLGYVKMAVSIEADIDNNEICCYDNVTYNMDKQKKDLEYHLSCLYKQYQKAKEELKTNLIGKMF